MYTLFLAFIYSLGHKSLHLILDSQVTGGVILVPHSGTVQLSLQIVWLFVIIHIEIP